MSLNSFAAIVTQNKTMRDVVRQAEAVAASPWPVLITGETGTGKELLARRVHTASRHQGELVTVNVAGLDDTMFSDTLFGHAKGAFTSADRARSGLITKAAQGTLFLDEIGDLAVPSQVKLLRLLQEGTYYPLGADNPRESSARVIAATNVDVVERVNAGAFRQDLYYRLRVHHLHVPPLRERREDLPLLIKHILEKAAAALNRPAQTLSPELYRLMETYAFPGNVRELEAAIFDAVAKHQGGVLPRNAFAITSDRRKAPDDDARAVTELEELLAGLFDLPTVTQAKQALIAEAMRRSNGNQGVAADMIGMSRKTINEKVNDGSKNDQSGTGTARNGTRTAVRIAVKKLRNCEETSQ